LQDRDDQIDDLLATAAQLTRELREAIASASVTLRGPRRMEGDHDAR
jgi:hypothetical protein